MRFIFFTIILSLAMLFFIGCSSSDDDKITVGDGLIYTVTEQGIEIITKEKFIALNIELSGEIENENILIDDDSLFIMKETNKRTNIYIAKKYNIPENIAITLKNYKKGKINIIESIKNVGEVDIVESKNVYRNTTSVLLGDFNNDDVVNLIDFSMLEENFLTTNIIYDIGPAIKGTGKWKDIYSYSNGDGIVDLSDLVVFTNNFNKTKPIIDNDDKEIEIESISIEVSRQNLEVDESVNISAVISPLNATNRSIIWSVSDSDVISISGTDNVAVVTAKDIGTSVITAKTANGKIATIKITVTKEDVTGIEIHGKYTHIWAWNKNGIGEVDEFSAWPGQKMEDEGNGWYKWVFPDAKSINLTLSNDGSGQTKNLSVKEEGRYWYNNGDLVKTNPDVDIEAPKVELGVKSIKIVDGVNYYEEETVSMTLNIKDNGDKNPIAYYTLDGKNASTGSILYKTGDVITIKNNAILSVYTVDSSGNAATYNFAFKTGVDATPPVVTTNIAAGRYDVAQQIKLIITDKDPNAKAYYTLDGTTPTANSTLYVKDSTINILASTSIKVYAVDSSNNQKVYTFNYYIGEALKATRTDFREETIYFLMTSRFYDGDLSNTRVSPSYESSGNSKYNDPSFRGDFKGLIEKLDYIKALGFTAIWITPPVLNRNYYDYHGYHAWDMTRIDGRLESPGATYQDLINEIHQRDMKIMQDIVLNHSGRYGLKGQCEVKYWGDRDDPEWGKDSEINYYDEYNPNFEYDGVSIEPKSGKSWYNGDLWQKEKPEFPWEAADEYYWWNGQSYSHKDDLDNLWGVPSPYVSAENYRVYHFQWPGMYESQFTLLDPDWFHRFWLKNWEDYSCQLGTIHEDCLDLNTESKVVQDYLIDAFGNYIRMGVDAFRVDTVKHISRNTFNRRFNPAFHEIAKQSGNNGFYMAGEVCVRDHGVWNKGNPALSQPFYTWKERSTFDSDDLIAAKEAYDYETGRGAADQPTSDNHLLLGNTYREPDYSKHSGLDVIDFRMHWNFANANTAFGVRDGDKYTNDATWNLTYVESHDYSPLEVGNSLYARMSDADTMAENWSLMFTWRGIPTILYGNEILFKAGEIIDEGPNRPLEESGRAYFGPHLEGNVEVSDFGVYKNATGEMANTLNHPLAQHLIRLNRIRHNIPALQKGQYSTEGISGDMAFKRRFTDEKTNVDSFVLVTISGDAVFTGIPNGNYIDAITGDEKVVSDGKITINCSGKGNARIYVLDLPNNPAPGKIGETGKYLK